MGAMLEACMLQTTWKASHLWLEFLVRPDSECRSPLMEFSS